MKVYINREIVEGPWGGGNKSVVALIEELNVSGHEVTHILASDCDILFCFDPRPGSKPNLVNYHTIWKHRRMHGGLIVQRVGDLGTHGKPELTETVVNTVEHSDLLIFPSYWAENVLLGLASMNGKQLRMPQSMCAKNAPQRIFYEGGKRSGPLHDCSRLVTHHWSMNSLKGFEFYRELGEHVDGQWAEFTYIGRRPYDLGNAHLLPPMDAMGLTSELREHDIYVTASVLEAGANHVLEALACGLPVIYHKDGGSIVEYVQHCGASFDGTWESFMQAFEFVKENYEELLQKCNMYNDDINGTARNIVKKLEWLFANQH